MKRISIVLLFGFFTMKSYSVDTLFVVFNANEKNQSIARENSFCQHLNPHSSKICLISNYHKIRGTVSDKSVDCLDYEFIFYNYTVIDSAWHKTFMDTLIMSYKNIHTRPDGTISTIWFNESYLRKQRDPIILQRNYLDTKRDNVFFLSDLSNKENIASFKKKMEASINTVYLIDTTEGLPEKLFANKVSWNNQPSE